MSKFGYDSFEGKVTGETTAAYVTVLEQNIQKLRPVSIRVTNTDGAESMYFKVLTYKHTAGQSAEFVPETSLATTECASVELTRPYAKFAVQVKQNSGAGDYQIDLIGHGIGKDK